LSNFVDDEPREELGLVAQYIVVPRGSGRVRSVAMSPSFPDYVAVVYHDEPPKLFDVRSKLPDLIRQTVATEELRPLILNASLEVPINARTPACSAAFRRMSGGERAEEVAFAFGEDGDVQRFGLIRRRPRPPVAMEDPVSLAYSTCGRRLLCGGKNGLLALYDVEESPVLINSARGHGSIVSVAVNYRDLCLGLTDRSLFFGFNAKSETSREFNFRDGDTTENHEALWSTVVCDPFSSFVLAATENGRFWVARTESFDGASCDSIPDSRIVDAQFLPDNWLMITSTKGVVLHRYETNDDGKIVAMAVGDIFDLDHEKGTILGARQYEFAGCRAICIAVAVN
jgi:hypothetical protein